MVKKTYPLIASEGWLILTVLAVMAAAGWWYVHWLMALPLLFLMLAGAYLLRDPVRKVPALPLAIVSPVDGLLAEADEADDPFLQRRALRLRLYKQNTGVFSIRSPIEGKIQQQWFQSETHMHANWVQTDEGDDIVWAMQGKGWRKPHCQVHAGERVGQGQRCGFQWLGGEVAVYLPLASRTALKPGDRVVAGETVIASLVHNTAPPNIGVEQSNKQEA